MTHNVLLCAVSCTAEDDNSMKCNRLPVLRPIDDQRRDILSRSVEKNVIRFAAIAGATVVFGKGVKNAPTSVGSRD